MTTRVTVLVLAMLMALGMMAGPSAAHHGSEPVVPAHQHWVNGEQVGPNACEDGMSIEFDHFHMRAHQGEPGQRGVVTATGC